MKHNYIIILILYFAIMLFFNFAIPNEGFRCLADFIWTVIIYLYALSIIEEKYENRQNKDKDSDKDKL